MFSQLWVDGATGYLGWYVIGAEGLPAVAEVFDWKTHHVTLSRVVVQQLANILVQPDIRCKSIAGNS